jgi:hypothetical protein
MANIIKKKSDPIDTYHHDAGKGCIYRPTNSEKFDSNWDLIFGKKDQNDPNQKPNQGETK